MTPSFALSLSFDGIRLLHRAAGGWRVVGDVALDAHDLGGALAELRAQAEDLAQDGVFSKLLLPNEQIKYLTIETPDKGLDERRAAAALALDGATPYAVIDLAFDISVEGDKTHVAAVARETLAEAEQFAVDHNFQPVSFAAVPGDSPYLGEPFFGPTSAAESLLPAGDEVTPDGIAVVIIGEVDTPDTVEAEAEVAASGEPESAPKPDPQAEPVAAETSLVAEEAPGPDVEESLEAEPSDISPEPAEIDIPAIGFASRRAERQKEPIIDGANRASAATVTAPVVPVDDTPAAVVAAPSVPPAPPVLNEPAAEPQLSERSKPARRKTPQGDAELERMTVFGARQSQTSTQPRMFGLFVTAGLLVFLAGFAAWASVFMNEGSGFTSLFGGRTPEVAVTAPDPIETPEPVIETASLDPVLTEEDSAVLDALSTPEQPAPPRALTDAEVDSKYATEGIWTRAPDVPETPAGLTETDSTYLTNIAAVSAPADALALPPMDSYATDRPLGKVASPAAAGTQFALDARGLVIPTATGALSPDGIVVFLGRPAAVPPATLARLQVAPEEETAAPDPALAAVRPQPRPNGLQERVERTRLGGLSRDELAAFRPSLRPASAQELAAVEAAPAIDTDAAITEALTAPDPVASATRLAIAESLRPDMRPRSLSQRSPQRTAPREETRVASAAATIAPRTVTPKIPSSASVAKAATTKNAINLRSINLIGVYGKPSNRRALVRLSSGRYKKVIVGDNIDGGVVSAIGDGELRYRKRGRDLVLKMPR